MIVRPTAERPMKLALRLLDWLLVDAGVARAHQTILGEFPILIAIGTEPLTAVIVVFIGIANSNAAALESPDLLDQPVVELKVPFARQEGLGLGAAGDKLGAIAPARVERIGLRHLGCIAAVPAIFGETDLLYGTLLIEGRKRRAGHLHFLFLELVQDGGWPQAGDHPSFAHAARRSMRGKSISVPSASLT